MNVSFRDSLCVVSCGNHAVLVDLVSHAVSAPIAAGGAIRVASLTSGCGNSSAGSASSSSGPAGSTLVLGSDDKLLRTYSVSGVQATPISETRLPKRPAAILPAALPPRPAATGSVVSATAEEGGVLIVAGRCSDIIAVPHPVVASRQRALLSHTASIVTCLGLSLDGAHLLSGDRDERIRVSAFPHTWRLEAVCSGHTKFVSALRVLANGVGPQARGAIDRSLYAGSGGGGAPEGGESGEGAGVGCGASPSGAGATSPPLGIPHAPSSSPAGAVKCSFERGELLVSGGGDSTVRLWYWRRGLLLHTLYLYRSAGDKPAASVADGAEGGGAAAIAAAAQGPIAPNHPSAAAGAVAPPGPSPTAMRYGFFSSAGPHTDPDMAEASERPDEEEGPGGGGEAPRGKGASAAAEEEEEEAGSLALGEGEGAGAPAPGGTIGAGGGTGAAGMEEDEGTPAATAAPPSSSLPPAAARRPTRPVHPRLPTAFPAAIVEHGPTGLIALFLEGEPAVRVLRVCLSGDPDWLACAPGGGEDGGEAYGAIPAAAASSSAAAVGLIPQGPAPREELRVPQARLEQIGVIPLQAPPLCIAFAPAPPGAGPWAAGEGGALPLLLVGGPAPGPEGQEVVPGPHTTAQVPTPPAPMSFAAYRLSLPHPGLLAPHAPATAVAPHSHQGRSAAAAAAAAPMDVEGAASASAAPAAAATHAPASAPAASPRGYVETLIRAAHVTPGSDAAAYAMLELLNRALCAPGMVPAAGAPAPKAHFIAEQLADFDKGASYADAAAGGGQGGSGGGAGAMRV